LTLTPEVASRKNFLNGMMRIDNENLSGIILFTMLNILLLMLNVLDLNYFLFDGKLPKGVDHKAFVHDEIGTLIMSVIVAILIILFYFRGELNFYKQSKWIKIMAFIWIFQNAFMIFSSAYRNDMYIDESGISYKKIGVYVYLLLTMIGLITTFIKVWKVKTNWYLFRINASVYYYILILSCIPNWDVIITNFNIKKHDVENKKLEKYLLLDLSYKNLPQLLALPDSLAYTEDSKAREYYNYSRGTYYHDFRSGLAKKLYDFMEEYPKLEWQSYCSEKARVYNDIVAMKDDVRSLKFQNAYIGTLKPLQMFSNVREFSMSDNYRFDLSELSAFPKLEKLKITNANFDSLEKIPRLNHLRELDLSGNGLTDISGLSKLTSVEILDLSGYNKIKSYAPLLAMKNLKYLKTKETTQEGLEIMKRTFPNVKIEADVKYVNSVE
jgi:Leucine-rich repeat (LRR) protein